MVRALELAPPCFIVVIDKRVDISVRAGVGTLFCFSILIEKHCRSAWISGGGPVARGSHSEVDSTLNQIQALGSKPCSA